MGGGVAFLDFDGDGFQDLFFVNGGETPRGKSSFPVRNALYRNIGNGEFEDVSAKAGVDRLEFYGMGVAVADFDNDGFPDLYVTGFPVSALFHNNGDGTFTDITDRAQVRNAGRWAASAAWFDFDRDGYLDLVVTNYAHFSFDDIKKCELNGRRTYCEQKAYPGMPLTLYHNNGDGTFTDVSAKSGLAALVGRALGVVSIDVNDDDWPDLFVARDASPNLLLLNKGDGTFIDSAVNAEVAYDAHGVAKAGMGVDAGDINGDGKPDFAVTNFNDEYHSLFISSSSLLYTDQSVASRLAAYTKSYVGWGTHFIDYDNDGNLDLLIVNGHINQVVETTRGDVKYEEPPLLLRNDGNRVFRNMRDQAGSVFHSGYRARGLAVGDFDNDGGIDAIFTRLDGKPVLLHNNVGQKHSWIGFELQGTESNRDAIGAKITVEIGERKLVRWITGGASYLSSHDKRVVIGLPGNSTVTTISAEIRWPSGTLQRLSMPRLKRYYKIVEPRSNQAPRERTIGALLGAHTTAGDNGNLKEAKRMECAATARPKKRVNGDSRPRTTSAGCQQCRLPSPGFARGYGGRCPFPPRPLSRALASGKRYSANNELRRSPASIGWPLVVARRLWRDFPLQELSSPPEHVTKHPSDRAGELR
ncbi:MAG: CRTAC1 family protein [Acidobacteria bacterium]|nr:MAG: CRTAC1 family protein [Acidobacteriota bacterium]PYU43217.1 MAG: CRTAC1 family protein [Acidobacteriota bacterium]PYU74055.1 MAG: CRTAC1 family protein [Acidobacteriota bacterium]